MCNGVNLEKERELFEQWFVTKYPCTSLDRDKGVVGTYWHERVEMSWQSWLSSIDREGYKSQQVKVDDLQARVDETLKILKGWDDQSYRDDMDQLIGEIEDILKGNKDETGLN